MQSFFMKNLSPYFVIFLQIFPISKIISLAFVVQTMIFQAKLPSHYI